MAGPHSIRWTTTISEKLENKLRPKLQLARAALSSTALVWTTPDVEGACANVLGAAGLYWPPPAIADGTAYSDAT